MNSSAFWRCFAVGLSCGMRSMTGPAVTRWRAHDPLRLAFAALAAGELIADKLPATPPRTIPPALLFRAFSGGFSGRSVAVALDADRVGGMLAGVAGAIAAAYLGVALRAKIVHATRLPDPLVALVEDVIAVSGAAAATHG